MEDAIYEIKFMRRFAGLKLGRLTDETIILKFRHFLEQHGLVSRLVNSLPHVCYNRNIDQQ
jgi:IS5 family transposase